MSLHLVERFVGRDPIITHGSTNGLLLARGFLVYICSICKGCGVPTAESNLISIG
jgi:hypothetical protein